MYIFILQLQETCQIGGTLLFYETDHLRVHVKVFLIQLCACQLSLYKTSSHVCILTGFGYVFDYFMHRQTNISCAVKYQENQVIWECLISSAPFRNIYFSLSTAQTISFYLLLHLESYLSTFCKYALSLLINVQSDL